MKRAFLTTAATILVLASSAAFAAGPNDGPKYPTTTSNKQYTDQRIMDHNNGAPRYPVAASTNQRSQNATSVRRAGQGTRVVRRPNRYGPVAAHANGALGYHG